MFYATFTISRAYLVPVEGENGVFTAFVPGKGVVSVQPHDGSIEFRPEGTHNAWEKFRVEGNKAVFFETDGLTFAIPLVD